jgi:hypothetical protein
MKQPSPAPRPYVLTLDMIEGEARAAGCEELFGPQRVKLIWTVIEYAPYPEAGPGRWKIVSRDAITEAVLEASRSGIAPICHSYCVRVISLLAI